MEETSEISRDGFGKGTTMMDYEKFKDTVKRRFLGFLPPEYGNAVLEIRPIKKTNCTMDGLVLHMGSGERTVPVIYVDRMYEYYLQYGDMEETLQYATRQFLNALKEAGNIRMHGDVKDLRDSVVMTLINTEKNREILAEIPNRGFLDLSVVYRRTVTGAGNLNGSVLVTNELAEGAGMTEQELFRCAYVNTARINGVTVMSMAEVFSGVPGVSAAGCPALDAWVITNSTANMGAVSMVYRDALRRLAEKLGGDLFILPSSVHEVIAVRAGAEPGGLAEMVHTVNREAVSRTEFLSDSVYRFERKTMGLKVEVSAHKQAG